MTESNAVHPAKTRLYEARENIRLQKIQLKQAAVAVSLYLNMVESLRGEVPEDEIHNIAAKLTTGMLSTMSADMI